MDGTAAVSPRWIVSRRFDLAYFFGGAGLSALFLLLYFVIGAPIVALWWIWLLAFDGPHIGAAFTRTYLDRREWATRPGLLLTSLLTFAIGPLFLTATILTRSDDPFLLFLGFATFYGYYHVVRQHYGFVALYNAVNGERDARLAALDRRTLYLGCWLPYAYFLVTHPRARNLLRLPADPGRVENVIAWILAAIWIAALVRFIVARGRDSRAQPKVAYLLLTVILYGAIYFAIARYEPVYAGSTGPDQDFLLLSIVIVIFHNVQYLGLVWFHNRNRYSESQGHGLAHLVNRTPLLYLGACALFSVAIYLTFACSTGVFPLCAWFGDSTLGPVRWTQIGLCLWWGLAMNHYYLDQKIWRIRGDEGLQRALLVAH
jgi:hypothetical protein